MALLLSSCGHAVIRSAACPAGVRRARRVAPEAAPSTSDAGPSEELEDWEDFFKSNELDLPEFVESRPRVGRSKGEPTGLKGQCYGCGVGLQTDDDQAAGFVNVEAYDKAARNKHFDTLLCARCVSLTHGRMVPAVQDFSQKQSALLQRAASSSEASTARRPLLTPQELRDKIKVVRDTKSICVMLVDVLDASGSFLTKVRELVGANPVVVVATKCDLLPRGTELDKVQAWMEDLVSFKNLNSLGVYLISSKTGLGLDRCLGAILSQRQGRDVYVVGAANVGKTAFVRAMLADMRSMGSRHFDATAFVNAKRLPVESTMPGTTLGLVRLGVFSSGGNLYDTPGLHLHHRVPHFLTPDELKSIHPRGQMRAYVPPAPFAVAAENRGADASGPTACATYHWGALLRIDVLEAPNDTHLVFFGTGFLQVYPLPLLGADEVVEYDPAATDVAPEDVLFASQSVLERGGLRVAREADVKAVGFKATLADVAVSGMPGWVSIVSGGLKGVVKLRIWAPKGVEAYVRPPIPCAVQIDIDKFFV